MNNPIQIDSYMEKIIQTLKDHSHLKVGQITELTGFHRNTVSKKLAILELAGIVEHKEEGRAKVYRVTSKAETKVKGDWGLLERE